MNIVTFPNSLDVETKAARTPEFMRPNTTPYAAVLPHVLTAGECDAIVESLEKLKGYTLGACGALTRECHSDPTLDPIEKTARALNWMFWNYDLDPGQHSWMQTYTRDDKYPRHMDGSSGQMRKLTAVVMLTDETEYKGGDLQMHVSPDIYRVPKAKGTIVVFLPWVEHEVTPILHGKRQTINMGFWGPPFR